jgi:hypothetical protein
MNRAEYAAFLLGSMFAALLLHMDQRETKKAIATSATPEKDEFR